MTPRSFLLSEALSDYVRASSEPPDEVGHHGVERLGAGPHVVPEFRGQEERARRHNL